jgi:beta-galactosidase
VAGNKVIEKKYSSNGVDQKFVVTPDDTALRGDGADSTRVVLQVTDEFGAPRPYATGSIVFTIEGPAEIVGDNPFGLVGGCGAIWVRAKHQSGKAILRATHAVLGTRETQFQIIAADTELV